MTDLTTAQQVLLAFCVAVVGGSVPLVLTKLGELIRGIRDERRKRRFSKAITMIYHILDGSGYGRKDEINACRIDEDTRNERKGFFQCVPRTWLMERGNELEKEFKSLGISAISILEVPVKSHLVGYLFRMKDLLEDGDLKEARRFSNDFADSLQHHPWDRDNSYVPEDLPTLTDSTSISDRFVNSSPR